MAGNRWLRCGLSPRNHSDREGLMDRRTILQFLISSPLSQAASQTLAGSKKAPGSPGGIVIGTHYEYPFGGNAWRKEWRPKNPGDFRRDLTSIRKTGFDLIRIRIGFDSNLDDTAFLL